MRSFNVTGVCVPGDVYMADISGKIGQIKQLVDQRKYFTINRARQYGKTTTLLALRRALKDEYIVASISFEGLGNESFDSPAIFCADFIRLIKSALRFSSANEAYAEMWQNNNVTSFPLLSEHITAMCKDRKVVLMIDEVDKTSNNRVFLDFLGMLRTKYLARASGEDYTFQSVILAGVYDIKNIKQKMIRAGAYTPGSSEGGYNSPWNIAASFVVDMSLNEKEIASMLEEYENDHHTGMDIKEISGRIHYYTNGYPFLVSRICQSIDEEFGKDWTINGIKQAVDELMFEKNTLFEDLIKNILNNPELRDFIYEILILGDTKSFNIYNPLIDLGATYGFFIRADRSVAIHNRIFGQQIANFLTDTTPPAIVPYESEFVSGGRLNMELVVQKFAEHYGELYSPDNEKDRQFLERHGRMLFLTYLRPIVNGSGFYHIESQLTDSKRMDIVVDYGNEQFVIELKTWRGEAGHARAYEQLTGYMETMKAGTGYLLTFDFRKEGNREPKAGWVEHAGMRIYDVVV